MTTPYYFTWSAQNSAVDFPVSHAAGDQFILPDDRRVFDMISTSFQANFGHSHQTIRERIQRQLEYLPITSPKSAFDLKARVSRGLLDLIGLGDGKIFYTVSGAEAVENALKIARQQTGRRIVMARQKSYHGASLGALSVTGDWRNDPHLTYDEGTLRIPEPGDDPECEQTRKLVIEAGPDNIAAVIVETISGTNGMAIPPQSWFDAMFDLCREFGIYYIADEVLVGFGRCQDHFAFQSFQLKPDMITLSKGITGGYIPFGAVWTSAQIASEYDDDVLACGLTNYGHPLGLAALEGVLDTMVDPGFMRHKATLEKMFAERVWNLRNYDFVSEVRCRGLMAAVDFNGRDAVSWQHGFDAGMHLFGKGGMNIFAPPLNSDESHLSEALDRYENILKG
ncbi:MAG: aspartate aminotransferase family protein [Planctomycetota bacterium]